MSAKLAMRVLESDLSPALKPVAVTLALFGNDAGARIYPSVDRLAHLVGLTRRTVERQLATLRSKGILIAQGPIEGGRLPGGRGRSVLYQLDVAALPTRAAFRKPRRQCQGSGGGNPDASAGVELDYTDTPTLTTGTATPMSRTPTLTGENPDAGVGRIF